MANKASIEEKRQRNLRRNKERQYEGVFRKLRPYPCIAAVLLAVVLLLFFAPWADIYNADIGDAEVSVSGWSCVASAVTGNYTSAEKVYGDMAIPFYYYAADYCESLGLYALLAGAAVSLSFMLQMVTAIIKKAYVLNVAAVPLNVAVAVLLLICFGIGLSMAGSDIIPIYCSNNPACSIRSFAIIPALVMLCCAAINLLASVKYFAARKILK